MCSASCAEPVPPDPRFMEGEDMQKYPDLTIEIVAHQAREGCHQGCARAQPQMQHADLSGPQLIRL